MMKLFLTISTMLLIGLINTQVNSLKCYAYIGTTATGTMGTTANCTAETYCSKIWSYANGVYSYAGGCVLVCVPFLTGSTGLTCCQTDLCNNSIKHGISIRIIALSLTVFTTLANYI